MRLDLQCNGIKRIVSHLPERRAETTKPAHFLCWKSWSGAAHAKEKEHLCGFFFNSSAKIAHLWVSLHCCYRFALLSYSRVFWKKSRSELKRSSLRDQSLRWDRCRVFRRKLALNLNRKIDMIKFLLRLVQVVVIRLLSIHATLRCESSLRGIKSSALLCRSPRRRFFLLIRRSSFPFTDFK